MGTARALLPTHTDPLPCHFKDEGGLDGGGGRPRRVASLQALVLRCKFLQPGPSLPSRADRLGRVPLQCSVCNMDSSSTVTRMHTPIESTCSVERLSFKRDSLSLFLLQAHLVCREQQKTAPCSNSSGQQTDLTARAAASASFLAGGLVDRGMASFPPNYVHVFPLLCVGTRRARQAQSQWQQCSARSVCMCGERVCAGMCEW